jgi:hypothetical protein
MGKRSGFALALLFASASCLTQAFEVSEASDASEAARPLARANPAVLCYAETVADDAALPLMREEIQRRNLTCSAEIIEGGKARLASSLRAQESLKLSSRAAKPAHNPIVYCLSPGTTQRVRCPNY